MTRPHASPLTLPSALVQWHLNTSSFQAAVGCRGARGPRNLSYGRHLLKLLQVEIEIRIEIRVCFYQMEEGSVCGGDEWTVSVSSSSSSLCALGRKRNGKTRGCARCSLFPHALFLSLKSSWRNLYVFSIKVDIMLLRFIERTNELGNGQQ